MKIAMDNDEFMEALERRKKTRIFLFAAISVLVIAVLLGLCVFDAHAERTGFYYPLQEIFSEPGPVRESADGGLKIPYSVPGCQCTVLLPDRPRFVRESEGAIIPSYEGEIYLFYAREREKGALARYAEATGLIAGETIYDAEAEGWFGSWPAKCHYETVRVATKEGKRKTLRSITYEILIDGGQLTVFGATYLRSVRHLGAQVTAILSSVHVASKDLFTEVSYTPVRVTEEGEEAGPGEGKEEPLQKGGEQGEPMDGEFGEEIMKGNPNGIRNLPQNELVRKSGEAILSLPEWDGKVAFSFYHVGGKRLYEITLTGPDGEERVPDEVIEGDGFEYAFFVEGAQSGEWKFSYRGEDKIGTYAATWIPAEAYTPVAVRGGKGAEND